MNAPLTIFEFVIAVLSSSAFSAAITHLVHRRKSGMEVRKLTVETEHMEIQNLKDMVEFWHTMVTELTEEVSNLRKEVIEFKNENRELKNEISILKGVIENANLSRQ